MRIRHISLLLAFVLAPVAFAASDLEVVSFTADKTAVQPYEPVTVTVAVANRSPEAAQKTYLYLTFPGGEERAFEVARNVSGGWRCWAYFKIHEDVSCDNESFAGNTQAQLQLTFAVHAAHIGDMTARITSNDRDPDTSNNLKRLSLQPIAAADRADLAVSVEPRELVVPQGTVARWRVDVANHGADAAANVHVLANFYDRERPLTLHGDGWQCTATYYATHCTRPALASGATAPIDVEVAASDDGYSRSYNFTVFAEGNRDDAPANDTVRVNVGLPDTFQMLLVPLSAPKTNGANGSVWVTDVTVLATGDRDFRVHPSFCADYGMLDCETSLWARNRPHPLEYLTRLEGSTGSFLYVRAEDAHKLHLNARVYDETRAGTTAGAEIPIVRERQFSTSRVSLLAIPIAPEYRHALRVYDGDGRGGARVRIEIFADDEETPRASTIVTLTGQPPHPALSPFFTRPTRPAILQIDPLTLFTPEAGVKTMRIDVEPLDANVRLWSFVSITNNETHHVTTISQQ